MGSHAPRGLITVGGAARSTRTDSHFTYLGSSVLFHTPLRQCDRADRAPATFLAARAEPRLRSSLFISTAPALAQWRFHANREDRDPKVSASAQCGGGLTSAKFPPRLFETTFLSTSPASFCGHGRSAIMSCLKLSQECKLQAARLLGFAAGDLLKAPATSRQAGGGIGSGVAHPGMQPRLRTGFLITPARATARSERARVWARHPAHRSHRGRQRRVS